MTSFRREILLYIGAILIVLFLFSITQGLLLLAMDMGELPARAVYGIRERGAPGAQAVLVEREIDLRARVSGFQWLEPITYLTVLFFFLTALIRVERPTASASFSPLNRLLRHWPAPNRNVPPFLLPTLYLFCCFSLLCLYRLCPALIAFMPVKGNGPYVGMFAAQAKYMMYGVIAAAVVYLFVGQSMMMNRLRQLKWWVPALAFATVIGLTMVFGVVRNERRLWFKVAGNEFQPVEFGKILLVIFLVNYFSRHQLFGWIISWAREHLSRRLYWWTKHLFLVILFFLLFGLLPLALQRDFGPALLFLCVFLGLVYCWSGMFRTMFAFFVTIFALILISYYFFHWPPILVQRVDILLDPFRSALGRVDSSQMARTLWAFSGTKLTGAGWGFGMPHYIPIVYSEFMFAAVVEEAGMIGGIAVLGVFLAILYGIYLTTRRARSYEALLGMGIILLLGMQTLIILGGITSIIPLTGITFPFLSYGGSSLIASFMLIGIVLGIREAEER